MILIWHYMPPLLDKSVNVSQLTAALIVSGVHAMSRRVRDLTQRLEDHKIEHQHRYRRSRKSSTGCGGLRALYMLMMFVAMQRHGHAEAVHPVCGGSSPPISISRLDGPERVANVLRLGHGYAFPMHEAGSTPALGFQGVHLHITKGVEILAPHFYTSP